MGLPAVLLILAVIALAVYTIIPDLLLHRLGIGSRKRQYSPGVAITFDDGPDPEYTPRVLEILARHRVTAAFFVVGEKALRYPDLIKQIRAEGHFIGAHSLRHRYAWFMSPWETWRDWQECAAILEKLTGEPIQWVRPPWGTFNLATWWWLRANNKKAVLWNVEGHDWQARRSEQEIVARVMSRTKEGSIIVLHDAGGEKGAPENTVRALEQICRRIVQEQKLPLAPLEFPDWSGCWRTAYVLWEKWAWVFARLYGIERIDAANLLRLSKAKYKGPDIFAPDGRLLARKGDWVGEIHFDNPRLVNSETNPQKMGIRLLRQVKMSLPVFARYVTENPKYQGIDVFLGLTLIHRGVRPLGFEVQDVPASRLNRRIAWMQKLIVRIYYPGAGALGSKLPRAEPKLVWISRQQLFNRWLSAEAGRD